MPDADTSPAHASALLRCNAADWLAVVAKRHSRRAFVPRALGAQTLRALADFCAQWTPYPDARVALITHPDVDIFTGILGSYGKVEGAPHALAFIGDEDFVDQHVGYTGEAVVLEATRLGLSTCWVGGFFNAKKAEQLVALARGERIVAVSPVGFSRSANSPSEAVIEAFAGAHHRRPIADLVPRDGTVGWPEWAVAAVETARLAPSAMNRQPWRFRFEDGGLVVAKDSFLEPSKVSKRLDIGIAMLHASLAAEAHEVRGVWTDLSGVDVARFDPRAVVG